jgi:hypothetical protein
MRLNPATIAANRSRHARERRYPAHTLAPDPHQPELELRPQSPSIGHNSRRFADVCPRCRCVHTSAADAEHCRQANAQREQD